MSDQFIDSLLEGSGANNKNIETLRGSIAFIEKQISTLESQRDNLALNSAEWQKYTTLIDNATLALLELRKQFEGLDFDGNNDGIKSATQNIKDAFGEISKDITGNIDPFEALWKQTTETQKDELDDQLKNFKDKQKQELKILKDSLRLQNDIRQEFTYSSIELINTLFDAQINGYEDDLEANSLYYDGILENQTLSDEQREAIEIQRQEKEDEIREKQKQAEKKERFFLIRL